MVLVLYDHTVSLDQAFQVDLFSLVPFRTTRERRRSLAYPCRIFSASLFTAYDTGPGLFRASPQPYTTPP
jgi:hypothetical protein